MSEFVSNGSETTQAKTPSDAIREYYKDELAAGTLSEADLVKLQAIAEENGGEIMQWAKEAGEHLKPEAEELVQSFKEHGEALKAADADGILTGAEFVKDGLPIIDDMLDFSVHVDDEVREGVHVILDGGREIIEARGEMDGADPAVTEAKLAELDDAEIRINDYMDWRQEQIEGTRDAIDAKREEIEAHPDLHQLPHVDRSQDASDPNLDHDGSVAA